jgi:hypothetical protein
MNLKNIVPLVVIILLATVLPSCSSSSSRFVITQSATTAITPITITPTTIVPTTITPTTIKPRTIVPTTIVPTTITPTTITPTTITATNVSASRDLTGIWKGTGVSYWIDGGTGDRIARTTWSVTLNITQSGNSIEGTITMTTIKQETLTPQNIPIANYGPDKIENGRVLSADLIFNVDEWLWFFTFTTDIMSGQYSTRGPGKDCDPKSFILTRQK